MTTTEEYPHLKPERMRRGFIHRGIMVGEIEELVGGGGVKEEEVE